MSEFSWLFSDDRSERIKALQDEMAHHLKSYLRCKELLRDLRQDEEEQRPLSLVEQIAIEDKWYAESDPDDDELFIWRKAFEDDPHE